MKVVIIGQDPYHGPNQAHGLSFSVKTGVAVPPSLRNIFTELNQDLGIKPAEHGYLQSWAEQGVLLLNAVLTVEQGQAGAHQGRGWERFTDAVIAALNGIVKGLVLLLWGGDTRKRKGLSLILNGIRCYRRLTHRRYLRIEAFSAVIILAKQIRCLLNRV